MQPRAGRLDHQRVVAGVKLHFVNAPAKTVVRMQLGHMHIGQPGMRLHFSRAQPGAQLRQRRGVQTGRIELQRVLQRPVGLIQVVVDQRFRLVEHFMGDVHGRLPSVKTRSA